MLLLQDRACQGHISPFSAGAAAPDTSPDGAEELQRDFHFIHWVTVCKTKAGTVSFYSPGVHVTSLPPGTPAHGTEATKASLDQWDGGMGSELGNSSPQLSFP